MSLRPLWTPGGTRGETGSFVLDETNLGVGQYTSGAYPSMTVNWYKIGNIVGLSLASGGTYAATSASTVFSAAAATIPAAIRPTLTTVISQLFTGVDNGVGVPCRVQVGSNGSLTFQRGSVSGTDLSFSTTGWTGSGSKGLSSSWQVIYLLS